MSKAIGIDLGTTNSAACIKKLKTEIILNAEGDELTPSVVTSQKSGRFIKKLEIIVGKHAMEWQAQDPANTVVSIKRLMGRSFDDPDVQRLHAENRFPYKIKSLTKGSERSIAILLNNKEHTPEEISSKILNKIKNDCTAYLKEPCEYAVVTVPAYFNDKQKHATRMAAGLAGLKVQRLLPEPTAAAISFGVDELAEGESKTVLIYDLGGGTFDISILTIVDGQFIEQGKGGDMWLGGDDIDDVIQKYVYKETETDYEIDDITTLIERLPAASKNRFLGDMKRKVESAKIELSSEDVAFIEVLGLLKDEEGDIVDIEVELTRETLNDMLAPFVERTMTLTKKLIEEINFDIDLIDSVIMVGGSSCIPLVIQKVKELFGEHKVFLHERPMLAIAEGAAILAHRLAETYECYACGRSVAQTDKICESCGFDLQKNMAKVGLVDIVHTTSHDYYLELEGGDDYCLVERNTPLPFSTQASFRLLNSRQGLAHFQFYNVVNEENESIGDLWLSFDPEHIETSDEDKPTETEQEILINFDIDVNNIITVSAVLKNALDIKVSRTLSRGNLDEKFFMELEKTIETVNTSDCDYYVSYDFSKRSIKISKKINQIIDSETGQENPDISQNVERQLEVANAMLEEDESPFPSMFYAQNFIDNYEKYMSAEQVQSMEKSIKVLKEQNENGTSDEILEAMDDLSDELERYPELCLAKDLGNAIDILAEQDPKRRARLQTYYYNILNAYKNGDKREFSRLASEIMPEARAILDSINREKLHISKGIRK